MKPASELSERRMDSTEDENGSGSSTPVIPEDSPGSSVSSRLQDEYDELLKYAVVVPNFDPKGLPRSITDMRSSFMPRRTMPNTINDIQQDESTQPLETTSEELSEKDEDSIESIENSRVPAWTPSMQQQNSGHIPQQHIPGSGARKDVSGAMESPRGPPPVKSTTPARVIYNREVFDLNSPESLESTPNRSLESPDYAPAVDGDVVRMEGMLDQWCYDLKRNVLAEFSQSKLKLIDQHKKSILKERERHAAEVSRLQDDIGNLKELLHTYEQSMQRKDDVISNLTRAMQRQQEKFQVARTFSEWKIKHHAQLREHFASNLAVKHYQRGLKQKVWDSWHAVVEAKWRQRVEKACQSKAQEVCMNMTNDYEAKIASLNEALDAARVEVSKLHKEREKYEEMMKKAFMRGVCALNLEAMTMFHGEDQGTQDNIQVHDGQGSSGNSSDVENQAPPQMPPISSIREGPVTLSQEPVYSHSTTRIPASHRVVTSRGGTTSSQNFTSTTTASKTMSSVRPTSSKPKPFTATLSARGDVTRSSQHIGGANVPMGLAPPMSSILVERHQPVVKQTIAHAVASKHPVQSGTKPGIMRKIAGQPGLSRHSNTIIHPVKVVD
ncbi:unnamed protein product [Owenia fusiformis]|uniref:Centrosomal protein POC5 n=1 Tax=Owenia fusiformis TaxID=6347 RepID=A0A8J1TRH3_OWEFU|nr:unnamed protein product [Owenia fusiformis]